MKRWRRFRDRARGVIWQLRGLLRPREVEREMDEEHRFHIEMETERLIGEGVEPAEARRRALVAFGGVERYREEVREARWTRGLEEAWRDARVALRSLARRPLFTAVAVGTLGVAIAASTTLFSLVDAVLLRPIDIPGSDRLVTVHTTNAAGEPIGSVSLPDYVEYRSGGGESIELVAHHLSDLGIGGEGGGARAALGMDVSGNYFPALRVVPALGRFFVEGEADRSDAPAEVVLSHELWRGRFGGDPDVLGRTLYVNGQRLTIVGVAPAGFNGAMLGVRPAVFLPLGLHGRLQGRDIERRGRRWLQLFGRLGPDVSPEQASARIETTARRLAVEHEYDEDVAPQNAVVRRFSALPPRVRDMAGRFTLLLWGASAVLLLVAAVNVGGMLLARASRRGREVALRRAIGAGRARLLRQLGVEGLVLGLLAAAAAVALTFAATRVLAGIAPSGVPGFGLVLALDGPVLGFALAAALSATVVFSLVPAWHGSRSGVAEALRGRMDGPARSRGRRALVAGQVALTVVLLVSAGLFFRTLRNAVATDHGFEPAGVVLAELNLGLNGYDEARGRLFHDALLDRLAASSAIASVALSTAFPLSGDWDETRAAVPGRETPDPGGWTVGWSAVSEEYFRVLDFPILGEPPEEGTEPLRLVVNEALAEEFWPGRNPIGERFRFYPYEAEVAGVAPTGRYRSLEEEPRLFAWIPLDYSSHVYVQVRPRPGEGSGDGSERIAAAVAELRQAVSELDPHVPLIGLRTLEDAMGQSLFFQRTAAALFGAFAVIGLLLSATGIFGLLAYTVEQRRREIGIRMAVGAGAAGVVRSVVGSGLRAVLAGLAAGLLAAAAATRVLEGLLFDVSSHDPVSFAAGTVALLAVAVAAAWWPARRATRVDPAKVLAAE